MENNDDECLVSCSGLQKKNSNNLTECALLASEYDNNDNEKDNNHRHVLSRSKFIALGAYWLSETRPEALREAQYQ